MIYPKCKTCKNRNTENCPLKKKDPKLIKEENGCFEDDQTLEASKGKGAGIMQSTATGAKRITGDLFRRMILNASAYIKKNADAINDLNVFPVPDGDTGSNMSMTMGSAVGDLRRSETDEVGDVAALTASAMLRGARGNSGVILSLLFRGISKELKGVKDCDGVAFANALSSGVDAAYKAVTSPAEGTILTVARVAANRAIVAAKEENSVEYVLEAACGAASDALEKTVEQNPVLKKAGVVDAGGMGWVVALTAMLDAIHGKEIEISDADPSENKSSADFGEFNTEDIKFAYCTEFIVERENDKDPEDLRDFLSKLGDSLVVVADEEIIKVHVHTNEPGTAMQEALTYGSFVTVKVENMKLQHTEKLENKGEKAENTQKEPENDFGVVAVAPGDGIAETFVSLGVDVTVSGGQTMNPSTEDILRAVNSVNAKTVFVLPNNKNIILAAEQAAAICEKQIVVIPTRSTPEGIAAMQGYDVRLSDEEIAEAMKEMAATADTMQITYAARNSEFDGMHISEGEYLALYGGKLAGNGSDLASLLKALAERAKEANKEIITLYYGADVSEAEAEAAAKVFVDVFDEDSVMLIEGGQPVYYYIISAE